MAERFRRKVLVRQPKPESVGPPEAERKRFKDAVVKTAKQICGRARYGKRPNREEWWWTEAQTAIVEKREGRKELERQPSSEARRRYKQAKTAAKCAVKQAEERVEEDSYLELENKPQ